MTEEQIKTLAQQFYIGEAVMMQNDNPDYEAAYTFQKHITSRGYVTSVYYLTKKEYEDLQECNDKIIEAIKNI